MVVKMVVKQLSEEDGVSSNALEISGDPAGNRTQMTGLEDRAGSVHSYLPVSTHVEIFWTNEFAASAVVHS